MEVQADEYGGGRPERMHSRLFAKTMGAFGSTPGDPTCPIARLHAGDGQPDVGVRPARRRGAIVGHLAMFEMTSPAQPPLRQRAAAARFGEGRPTSSTSTSRPTPCTRTSPPTTWPGDWPGWSRSLPATSFSAPGRCCCLKRGSPAASCRRGRRPFLVTRAARHRRSPPAAVAAAAAALTTLGAKPGQRATHRRTGGAASARSDRAQWCGVPRRSHGPARRGARTRLGSPVGRPCRGRSPAGLLLIATAPPAGWAYARSSRSRRRTPRSAPPARRASR